IGLFSCVDLVRIVSGQTLSLKQKEFIDAAFVSGLKNRQIIFRHIIPNVLGIVVIYASLMVPTMILFESFLSFLGLGVQEPMTSWGALLQEGAQNMQVALWQLIFPSLFLITTLFSFNFIGDGLRDALDPKDR
ncbi:MAG: ABC transporter permease subunit, partial [Neisseriaceae bacterium]|nr:ABC transporter permease subunit [Neisseriaceae bacterium]